jgi:hypothetical protein
LAANDNRLAPPPFWRTDYFEAAMTRPDRRMIDLDDVKRFGWRSITAGGG